MGFHEPDFDFEGFANFLIGGREVSQMGKRYYTGTVREREGDSRSVEAMARQGKVFTKLIGAGWQLKTSKLRERTEVIAVNPRMEHYKILKKAGVTEVKITRQREKGIDVKIATDLLVGAMDNRYDTAILVSSDSDLIPAIDCVRLKLKKRVEYVGFSINDPKKPGIPEYSTKPTFALIARTDKQRILVDTDLLPFTQAEIIM